MTLDLTILRNGRREAVIQADADPGDPAGLQDILRGWLDANRWHPGRWGEFEMHARAAGAGKVLAKVRP